MALLRLPPKNVFRLVNANGLKQQRLVDTVPSIAMFMLSPALAARDGSRLRGDGVVRALIVQFPFQLKRVISWRALSRFSHVLAASEASAGTGSGEKLNI